MARSFREVIPAIEITRLEETGALPKLTQPKDPALYVAYDVPKSVNLSGTIDPRVDARNQILNAYNTQGLTYSLHQRPLPNDPWWKTALDVAKAFVGVWTTSGASLATTTLSEVTRVDPYVRPDPIVGSIQPRGATTMAFQDGDSGFFGDIWNSINQGLQGGIGNTLLGLGTQAATGFINQQFAPQPMSIAMAQPTMAAVPAVIGAGRAVATVGRGFFNRFPNLATSLQGLRNRGANVSRSSLYSAMRRFGPEMLVSGGILTAAAVSELAVAGPGRRRMNPGNVKALRRAHRRMKSFHHLCTDNDMLYRRSRRK